MIIMAMSMECTRSWLRSLFRRQIAVCILRRVKQLVFLTQSLLVQSVGHLLYGLRYAAHMSFTIVKNILPTAGKTCCTQSCINVLHYLALHIGGHGITRDIRHLIRTNGSLQDKRVLRNAMIAHGQKQLIGIYQIGFHFMLI